jgi:CcmD family protein
MKRFVLAWCLAAGLCLSAGAWAQTPATTPTPGMQVPEPTRDLSRYKEEPVPGGTLLVVAYGVMWTLLAGLVARLVMQQSRLQAEVRGLQDRLDGELQAGASTPDRTRSVS